MSRFVGPTALALPLLLISFSAGCDDDDGGPPGQPDLSVPADLAMPADLATPPDLVVPADLAQPPADLTPAPMCSTCHVTQWGQLAGGRHKNIQGECLACHADGLKHQADPSKVRAAIEFAYESCSNASCHTEYKETILKDDGLKAGPYGGSIKTSKYLDFPKYQHLMGGHAFTIEYNEERAHGSMLKDHYEIKRKQNTACLQCKSTPVTLWWNESRRGAPVYGKDVDWAVAIQSIKDRWPQTAEYGTGCSHCHDPHAAGFRIIRKGVINAILERGTDPYYANFNYIPKTPTELTAKLNERGMDGKLTANARRLAGTLTCAQCHIEYTCGKGVDPNILRDDVPWRKARDIEAYYRVKYNNEQDWKHSGTGITGIKAQHPETEFYWESIHYKSGVSCTDCHTSKASGKTSHWFASPFKLPKDACEGCHPGEGAARFEQVKTIQKNVMMRASLLEANLDQILLKIESNPAIDPAKLLEAKERFMRALFFWEWTVVSENSAGFHNSPEANTNLGLAETEAAAARVLLGL